MLNMAEAEKTAQPEPSMEEILSSIRRIISEEAPPEPPVIVPVVEKEVSSPDVLNLTQVLEEDGSVVDLEAEQPLEISLEDNFVPEPVLAEPVLQEEIAPEPEPEPIAPVLVATPVPPVHENILLSDIESLLSPNSQDSAAHALGRLAETVEAARGLSLESLPLGDGARTVENIVLTLLRPILKEWLDQNLPVLVERIVEKEISRLTKRIDE